MVEIVAEISGNHGGSLVRACFLIVQAAAAGCDHAKFQYYRPEDMPDRHVGENEKMYQELMVHDYWLPEMFKTAKLHNIGLFASVFSARAAKEVLKYDVPYIKIASPVSTPLSSETYRDIADFVPRHVGLIVSSDLSHAGKMWNWHFWKRPFLRMYCPPGHPQELLDEDYAFAWKAGVEGFSDHSAGISAPLSFVRELPTSMIEKHLKLDDNCEDAAFSADRKTMELLCKLVHNR